MAKPRTIYENASPVFLVGNLDEAVTFYCDVLDFEKKWQWGDPVMRVGIGPKHAPKMKDFEIHLGDHPNVGPSGTSFVYFQVKNVEVLYERCQKVGADIYLELDNRDWGMKDFRVADPFGNRLGFGESISGETSG